MATTNYACPSCGEIGHRWHECRKWCKRCDGYGEAPYTIPGMDKANYDLCPDCGGTGLAEQKGD
jgi:DnaJ-class molecular chaperone